MLLDKLTDLGTKFRKWIDVLPKVFRPREQHQVSIKKHNSSLIASKAAN